MSTPPSQKTGAIGSIMTAMRHNPGVARPKGGTGALTAALVRLVQDLGGVILTEQSVDQVLVDSGRAVGVRVNQNQEYRAKQGVISSLDAKRLFGQLIDPSDIDAADAELGERVNRRIVNNS